MAEPSRLESRQKEQRMTDDTTHELTHIADLRGAPYNPRKIDKAAASGLGKSLDAFGDISGIVWNKRTGNLVAGHQRVAQLRKRGAKLELDGDGNARVVLYAPDNSPAQIFHVRVVDWDEGTEKAANVEANNRKIAGDFTPDLAGVLKDVETAMSELSFEELRFDDLRRDVLKAGREVADSAPQLGAGLTYSVIVDLQNEGDQKALLEQLEKEGYSCRLLIT